MSGTAASPRFERLEFLGTPRFVQALSTAGVAAIAASFALQRLLGWPGYIAIIALLVVLSLATTVARWHALDWRGILPISLIAFTAWCGLSVLWSDYQWASLSSALYLLAIAIIGVVVALARDVIQIVRIVADVLRVLLGLSLVLEVLSGIVLDVPIDLLGIRGQIVYGGPISGVFGDGSHLGMVALVAAITFAVELIARSIPMAASVTSIAGAVVLMLLSQSGVAVAAGVAVMIAALVLTGIRRVRPQYRPPILWGLVVIGAVALVVIIANLGSIVRFLQSTDQLAHRHRLWSGVQVFFQVNPLQGWGWVGRWRMELEPFQAFAFTMGHTPFASAFNAFLDVALQVGLVGLALFCGLVGLVLVRSMHLAVRQPSVVYLWPPLVLVGLVACSLTESSLLVEWGWFLLVVCVVKTANKLSWRVAFERVAPRVTPPELPRA